MAPTTEVPAPVARPLTNTRDIFPFFELPRELRDFVYGYALYDTTSFQHCTGLAVQLCNTTYSELLFISHQFQLEYQESANKLSRIHIFDCTCLRLRSKTMLRLPPPATSITALTFHLVAGPSTEGGRDLSFHMNWLRSFLSLHRNIRDLAVNVLRPLRDPAPTSANHDLEDWLELPCLTKLEVYDTRGKGCFVMNMERYEGFTLEKYLVVKWSVETGEWEICTRWSEDVSDEESSDEEGDPSEDDSESSDDQEDGPSEDDREDSEDQEDGPSEDDREDSEDQEDGPSEDDSENSEDQQDDPSDSEDSNDEEDECDDMTKD